MCGEYTDYTRSYHHPVAQFCVGSSRNWSVFLERPNTGRHEKAPVRCTCSLLAALYGAPRTRISLLFGSTHDVISHLQRMQNYAARVILCLPKSSSITIHLKSLHWFPIKVGSTYKIACLCYHCHSSTAP